MSYCHHIGRFVTLLVLVLCLGACSSGLIASESMLDKPAKSGPMPSSGRGVSYQLVDGKNSYVAECRDFIRVKAKQPENSYWCWAASAEMVHRWEGRSNQTQEVIVERIKGSSDAGMQTDQAAAASYLEILHALAPEVQIDYPKAVANMVSVGFGWAKFRDLFPTPEAAAFAVVDIMVIDPDATIRDFAKGVPAIAVLKPAPGSNSAHAVVVYGVRYAYPDPNWIERNTSEIKAVASKMWGGFRIPGDAKTAFYAVRIMDPEKDEPVQMGAEEFFDRLDHLVTRDKAKGILETIRLGIDSPKR
jgi:hypothetical protein